MKIQQKTCYPFCQFKGFMVLKNNQLNLTISLAEKDLKKKCAVFKVFWNTNKKKLLSKKCKYLWLYTVHQGSLQKKKTEIYWSFTNTGGGIPPDQYISGGFAPNYDPPPPSFPIDWWQLSKLYSKTVQLSWCWD